jgi:hypothetical protein
MGIKTFIFGDPEKQGMKYRIRVFDHGHHIKTATVKDRGQDRIELVVKSKDYGFLGEEIKLAFMINPEIPPHYFGNTQEIDFDVRDATQLADLFDICPEIVEHLNQTLYNILESSKKKDDNVIDAEFTEKKEKEEEKKKEGIDPAIVALTDPAPEKKAAPKERELSGIEQKIEKIPGVKTTTEVLTKATQIPHNIKTTYRGITILHEINYAEDEDKQKLMKKALQFCMKPGNAKCLRWLPKYLHIEPDISAIISQTELDGVGIMPMYYIKQSSAEISEKMLQRPKSPEDWKTTALYLICMLIVLVIFVVLILKLSGRL